MGDRGNIVIRDTPSWLSQPQGPGEAVFLYGHWSGAELPETLRQALTHGRERWTDAPYLARMIFDVMVGTAQGGETGYGISTYLCDNEYDLLVVLPATKQIVRLPEKAYRDLGFAALRDPLPAISFDDYVGAPERTWDNLTDAEVPA